MSSLYRGETKPRRQPPRHHIQVSASAHRPKDVSDPFPPLSSKQFPSFYVRSPIKNAYRSYMKVKSPYQKSRRT